MMLPDIIDVEYVPAIGRWRFELSTTNGAHHFVITDHRGWIVHLHTYYLGTRPA